jgi:hypothetical protein
MSNSSAGDGVAVGNLARFGEVVVGCARGDGAEGWSCWFCGDRGVAGVVRV